mmetsp:Transcript_37079/g.82471  ORF Transcript_37079/g.82471 Transcript_37079/m.82471 type:complete len:264 (-) Transcript_37079:864-1655(-)|eukprot:CAMPEP_0202909400 /NCGR_PEP_ID=MMETSP1392-20130828/49205_1 /ASSEMBLY_ACC=CAM_ASM_000868 /TAXON_ID=225041 /ORGANISM="Chlamydomonas chlamydogama, Strain SAG 11-48b" /LENGTH=263 /DNA_ID=CAMNT_0049599137 /DNA_START=383 /DNA_END=1174 /DNA_ORIENTATION=+
MQTTVAAAHENSSLLQPSAGVVPGILSPSAAPHSSLTTPLNPLKPLNVSGCHPSTGPSSAPPTLKCTPSSTQPPIKVHPLLTHSAPRHRIPQPITPQAVGQLSFVFPVDGIPEATHVGIKTEPASPQAHGSAWMSRTQPGSMQPPGPLTPQQFLSKAHELQERAMRLSLAENLVLQRAVELSIIPPPAVSTPVRQGDAMFCANDAGIPQLGSPCYSVPQALIALLQQPTYPSPTSSLLQQLSSFDTPTKSASGRGNMFSMFPF